MEEDLDAEVEVAEPVTTSVSICNGSSNLGERRFLETGLERSVRLIGGAGRANVSETGVGCVWRGGGGGGGLMMGLVEDDECWARGICDVLP